MSEGDQLTRARFLRLAGGGAAALAALPLLDVGEAFAAFSPADIVHFHSRPDLRPARLHVLKQGRPDDDHLFIAPSSGPGRRGPLILDGRGNVVWFRPTTPKTVMNFRRALYRGKPVLTWWEGKADLGLGRGEHVIVDASYKTIERLPAGAGRQSDLHEFMLTGRDTAIVTSYEVRDADLSAVGGPVQGKVIGGIVQELALPSGRVLFQWHSLDHVPIDETHAAYSGHPLDYFHVNSVDTDADGNLIVSARNTWTIYKVQRHTGKVLWRLGGKRSDFQIGPGAQFEWQHDVRHHDAGRRLTIFDNAAAPPIEPQSRVLVLELDRQGRSARLVKQYTHPRKLLVPFMGNAQVLPSRNVVVGWGGLPYVSEFTPDGALHFDARLGRGGMNYRAFRFPWVGSPSEAPTLVAQRVQGRAMLYVSWNGATEVAGWRFDTGPAADALQPTATRVRHGFETPLPAPPSSGFAVAVALSADGTELGRSTAVRY